MSHITSMNFELTKSWYDMNDELNEIPIKKEYLYEVTLPEYLGNSQISPLVEKNNKKSHISDQFVNSDEQLSVTEILALKNEEISEEALLKYQVYVTLQLKKYASNCRDQNIKFDINIHLDKFYWLLKSTEFLSNKRGLRDIKNKRKITEGIQRNSYEFCEQNRNCCHNKVGKCNKKHFVYNYLKSDIEEIIRYLNRKDDYCIQEICTTINTINYVFKHMYDEIV